MNLFQWLRLDRDIAYREIGILVAFVFVTSKSQSPILHEENQRSRSKLDLTAQITSCFFISGNRDFCYNVSLTFPKRDPRNPDALFTH
jgi:hypothetical protein